MPRFGAAIGGAYPAAPIIHTMDGEIYPDRLFDVGLYNPATKSIDAQRWLDDEKYQIEHHGHDDLNRHDSHIKAVCMVQNEPIPGEALDRWLGTLFRLKGPDLLRFKAIINVAELAGPMVIHGVQHVIHPPLMLKHWPSDDRRTRMVFITHDIDEQVLRDSLKQILNQAVEVENAR